MIHHVTIRSALLRDAHAIARVFVKSWRAAYPGILPRDYLESKPDWQRGLRQGFKLLVVMCVTSFFILPRYEKSVKVEMERKGLTYNGGAVVTISDADAHESENPATRGRQRTAFGQFLAHTTRLIIHLESSRFLPNSVTRQWIRRIKQIDIFQPSKGLLELDALDADYLYAADEYKPRRDVFDLAAAESMQFDREMHNIRQELDWIKAILKHVEV